MTVRIVSPESSPPASQSRVRVNAIANYLGRGWATAVGLLCLPLFIVLLGREAYGLIGAFAVIQAWAMLLDFGLTPTLNREIVRARAGNRSWQSLADLVRAIELVVFVLALGIVLAVFVAAPVLTKVWLAPQQLPASTVIFAIGLMGILAASRWIEQLYRGAIQGTEDQVWLNLIMAMTETARWGGALLIIRFVRADILMFFVWNLVVSAMSILILRRRVSAFLRQHVSGPIRADMTEIRAVRSFAGGMFLSSMLVFLLTQADKLVVGSHVTLAEFGLYALAATAAAGLLQLVQPMNVAILPRFTTLVEAKHTVELGTAFHAASQWLAAIVLPVGILVVALPKHALLAWTGQAIIAASSSTVLSLLMGASLLNAMANVPYMLQLAHGWTSLTNKINACAIVIAIPIMIWAAGKSGGVGAAATLVGLNLVSLIILSSLVLPRLLPGEWGRWALKGVFLPTIIGGSIAAMLRLTMPDSVDRWQALLQLGVAAILIGLPVLASLRYPRESVLALARLRRNRT